MPSANEKSPLRQQRALLTTSLRIAIVLGSSSTVKGFLSLCAVQHGAIISLCRICPRGPYAGTTAIQPRPAKMVGSYPRTTRHKRTRAPQVQSLVFCFVLFLFLVLFFCCC